MIFDIAQLVKIFVTEVAFEELVKTSSDWIALVKPLKVAGQMLLVVFVLYGCLTVG